MNRSEPGRLAVQSVFWRRRIDWVVLYLPAWLHPPLILLSTLIFFSAAASARRTVLNHLAVIFPGSAAPANWIRAFGVFHDFAWTLTDSAVYRLLKKPFRYELEGDEFLDQLAAGAGAIVLTAHMGNYDLGSAVFVEKLHREIRMVRAPEPDAAAAAHLSEAIAESGGGGVKVDYNINSGLLSFDLLNALRRGEIISIQGDRAMGSVAQFPAKMFNRTALLPSGPIVLALTAEVPIYPIFVVRCGHRAYRFITRPPIVCARSSDSREKDIAASMQQWADVLAAVIQQYWPQWHAFTPVFKDELTGSL
jgi:lauroyl/myristoyl acyltransferase